MAKFVYRLQNILNIKNKIENQSKSAYAEAMGRLRKVQSELEILIARKKSLEDDYRRLATGILSPISLKEAKNAMDYNKEEIKDKLLELRVAEKNLDVAKTKLNEAVKDRKIHEKLREHSFEEFLAELSAQEKKEIDEIVSYRFTADSEKDIKEN